MKYPNLFRDGQVAAVILHAAAHATRRNSLALPSHVWTITYADQHPGLEIFAADNSASVVVFDHGEVVFSAGRHGQVFYYQPGAWECAVEKICEEAAQAGCLPAARKSMRRSMTAAELEANCPDFAACPWMDAIEESLDAWEATA